MNDLRIAGYEFDSTSNTNCLPSASGIWNGTAQAEDPEPEDAILMASGLLPLLVEQAKRETIR